jgi:hypothetical protein
MRTLETFDLYLASYLLATGYRLAGTVRQSDRVLSCIEPQPDETDLAAYAAGTAHVVVTGFVRSLRRLKRLVFDRGGGR